MALGCADKSRVFWGSGLGLGNEDSRGRYRNKFKIVGDILRFLQEADNPGCKKTHIMYSANLSYRLLTRYMKDVLDAGLVDYDGACFYTITEKGKMSLNSYEKYENQRREVEQCAVGLEDLIGELEEKLTRRPRGLT